MDNSEENLVYMVGAEDELGDQHVFMTSDLERATRAYQDMKARYGSVRVNDGLADALGLTP